MKVRREGGSGEEGWGEKERGRKLFILAGDNNDLILSLLRLARLSDTEGHMETAEREGERDVHARISGLFLITELLKVLFSTKTVRQTPPVSSAALDGSHAGH